MPWGYAAVAVATVAAGYMTSEASKDAADQANAGTEAAIDATTQNTMLQIAEVQRQFDVQQEILQPLVEQQYASGAAYQDLLGINSATKERRAADEKDNQLLNGLYAERKRQYEQLYEAEQSVKTAGSSSRPQGDGAAIPEKQRYSQDQVNQMRARLEQTNKKITSTQNYVLNRRNQSARGPSEENEFSRTEEGAFLDKNLDQTSLADSQTLGDQVNSTLQADGPASEDGFINYISDNKLAAESHEDDLRYRNSQDVTMTGARGADTLTDRRSDVSLADQRGGESLQERRAGSTLFDERGNILNAEGNLEDDVLRQDVASRQLADGAAGTGVYGETFEASPGYEFMLEESQRELDRKNSAGGNYGGRALLEAQRRAKGEAAKEYYQYAAGRERDLSRLAGAESADAQRLDNATLNFLSRKQLDIARGDDFAATDIARADSFAATDLAREDDFAATDISRGDNFAATDIARADNFAATDISRGDRALDLYEGLRISDQERGDSAYVNYLSRKAGDASRLDSAAAEHDRLSAVDLQRRDQGYYNYLNSLAASAGFSNAAGTAVNSSSNTGAAISNAYANQGGALSRLYTTNAENQANITLGTARNNANTISSSANNFNSWYQSRGSNGSTAA